MDDGTILFLVLLVFLFVAGGWLLGVIGYFRANRALRELEALKRELSLPRRIGAAQASDATPAATPADVSAARPGAPWNPPPVVPVEAEPAPAVVTSAPVDEPPPAREKPARDIEALLTLQWGVWLGAAALLMSGVFLIRYAVDAGYFGPAARCVIAALLGLALLAGAEWLRRRPAPARPDAAPAEVAGSDGAEPADQPRDPWAVDQAPAALAAGGVALLFGAAYGAGPFYGLLPDLLSFILLAAAALAGLLVSLRFGQLVAAVGIAGAYATPLLVQTESPSLPGLFGYLLIVSAAGLAVVRLTAWIWLGWATTIAGAGWVLLAAVPLAATPADIWAPALFVAAAAALNLALLAPAALDHALGRWLGPVPFAALGGAGLLMEAQYNSFWPRAGVLLLVPIAVGKGAREPKLDRLPWLASLLFLLSLLLWALPDWQPTGEAITIEGVVAAVLPGAWAPAVIVPLLLTAGGVAGFLAVAGLAMERVAPRPLHWAALVGAVPVLTLAVTYAQVHRFQPDGTWALAALAVTALLVGTTHLAMRAGDARRAGVHAAGAAACLALACAMLLQDQWLTLAVALFLPALAWIEARTDLPALRLVALAVAATVLVRLLLNWYVIGYDYGALPVLNGLLAAYGVPALCFGLAAFLFRRRGDDLTVAVLESGAVAFASVLVALEVRHWEHAGDLRAGFTLDEAVFQVATLAVQALVNLGLARRTSRPVLDWAWRCQGLLAMTGAAMLLIFNPVVTDAPADGVTLLVGYLLPALLAAVVVARGLLPQGGLVRLAGAYAVTAGLVWIVLEVRDLFHPGAMGWDQADVADAELWAWSGAGLLYGAGLMVLGIRARGPGRALRMAALAIIGLISAKVFLIDMAGLAGLWRVVSFLGLGLMLIALGAIYRRFVLRPREAG
jgi:uncharacterized membrane protein